MSEWRKGRVIDWEEGTQTLTVEPWPDPAVHPLRPPGEPQRRELTGDESWSELDSLALPVRRPPLHPWDALQILVYFVAGVGVQGRWATRSVFACLSLLE